MKKILTLSLLSLTGFASQPHNQELYVPNVSKELIKIISTHPELTIDHVSSQGFELYGPVGTKQWLEDMGVEVRKQTHSHNLKSLDYSYPTFEAITKNLKQLAKKYSHIMTLKSIGKSVEGRDLWMVKISDNVTIDEVEPEFKYISSMHGDEITGRELTQFLIKDLLEAYGQNERITKLINNTELYIMPSMNPDGSNKRQRANANGQDLNRNFPDWVRGDDNDSSSRQPETIAVMNFQAKRNVSLSANFHGGAVVVNYPWDATYDLHPQDKLITAFSLEYANLNPAMRNSREFYRGITNGAAWYPLKGGMQDWSHFWYNDLQVTIELSDKKWPRYSNIPSFYNDNKASLLRFPELIHQGAGFKFSDKKMTGSVVIKSNSGKKIGNYGFDKGEFYKVLDVGTYEFIITDKSGESHVINTVVEKNKISKNGNYTFL